MRATERETGVPAHPSAEELASYVDGGLSTQDAARVSAHLADCDLCRTEVIEVSRLVATSHRAATPRRWWIGAASAAAVAVLALRVLLPSATAPGRMPDALRSDEMESSSSRAVEVVRPLPGADARGEGLVFVWRGGDGDASYRLTLADEAGAPVWTASTTDTLVMLPHEVELGVGSYLWRVDALFADGRTATSAVQRLTVLP